MQVKYQEPRTWGKSHSWFSLLSLHARNDDGEPYRVHYRPGSSLVDISSTNDKSWELWRSIPYEYKREEDIEELDIYSHLFQNMVHLINQKSSSGVAFVNGLPMFIKKPGNPIKLKVFSPTALIKSLPVAALHLQNIAPNRDEPSYIQPKDEEKVVLMATVVPHVNVVIENCVITILYEATGAIHFLPLLRVCMDDAKSVSQVSSSKIRVISSFRIMLESYEAQRNRWMEMVRPIEICIVYRARVVPFEQGNAAFEKLPTCFYSVLKKVDLAVSEPSLDICLFLVGELNLAGPFAVKHSPVTANCLPSSIYLPVDPSSIQSVGPTPVPDESSLHHLTFSSQHMPSTIGTKAVEINQKKVQRTFAVEKNNAGCRCEELAVKESEPK
eukprot:Gb_15288 [translate_table: standard]